MKLIAVALAVIALASPAFGQEKDPKDAKEAKDSKDAKKDTKKVDADAAIKKRLDEQKLNLNLDDTPFMDGVDVLHELTSVTFVFSPAAKTKVANAKVTLQEKDALFKTLLEKILGGQKLAYEVWKGVIFVTTKAEAEKKDLPTVKLEGEVKKKLEARRLTCNFVDTPLSEVLLFLNDFTDIAFSAGEKVDSEKVKVDVKLRDCASADVVAIICRIAELKATQKDGAVVLEEK